MRQIIFRAKCQSTGKWEYGYYSQDYANTAYITSLDGTETTVVDPYTLGQYTGLNDKNDEKIFEGDINQDKGIVTWNEDSASFCWDYKGIELMEFSGEKDWCEIIGNIHDNPELI